MQQVSPDPKKFPHNVIISTRPTDPTTDPATIRYELTIAADKLVSTRAQLADATSAAEAARSVLGKEAAAAREAMARAKSLEEQEIRELEALALATLDDVNACIAALAATRAARGAAVHAAEEARAKEEAAKRTLWAHDLAGLAAVEARACAELETWRARAARYPMPEKKPFTVEPERASSYSDEVARASGYEDAPAHRRAIFLSGLPGDLRKAIEGDEARLANALDCVRRGDMTNAIVLATEARTAAKNTNTSADAPATKE